MKSNKKFCIEFTINYIFGMVNLFYEIIVYIVDFLVRVTLVV